MKINRFLITLTFIATSTCASMHAGNFSGMPPQMPGMQGMAADAAMQPPSPEEFAQWYQEVNKEVDQFKAGLSEEERKQFDTEVENLTKVMTDILETEGPEGLDKFIEGMFQAEQPPMPQAPVEEEVKAPVEEEVKEPAKPKEPEIPAKSLEAAAKLVEDLIFYTERFMRKSEIIPEMPRIVDSGVMKGRIKEWKSDLTWEKLKGAIENLNKKLHDLQDRDPKTKKYKYLSDLLQQESLYNNLSHLLTLLSLNEPKAEAPAFGLGKVDIKVSRPAIENVIAGFVEAIYKLEIPSSIDKIIEKYEPRAKTLREEEESARKKSLEESKKPRTEALKKETAHAEPYGGVSFPAAGGQSSAYGYPAGYETYGMPSAYQPYEPYSPSSNYDYGSEPTSANRDRSEGKETDKRSGGTKSAAKDDSASTAPVSVKTDPSVERSVKKIDTALDQIAEMVNTSKLGALETHLTDSSPVDADLAALTIPNVIRKFNSVIEQVKVAKRTAARLSKAQQDQTAHELRSLASGHKSLLTNLHNHIANAKTKLASISADKQYAYFGGKQRDKASKDVVGKIAQPASLEELAELIEQFNAEVGPYDGDAQPGRPQPFTPSRPTATPSARTAPVAASMQEEEEEQTPTTQRGSGTRAPAARVEPAQVLRKIDKVGKALEDATRTIESNQKLKNIAEHLADANEPADQRVVSSIKKATQQFEDVLKQLNEIVQNIQALPEAQQKQSLEDLGTILQEHAPVAQAMLEQLNELPTNIERFKQYAYFNGALPANASKVTAETLAKRFPAPADLQALKNVLTVLLLGEQPEEEQKQKSQAQQKEAASKRSSAR